MARSAIYRPRRPEASALYQCLQQYWEEFQQAYTPLYEKDHGPLRLVVETTVERFLECGILRHGFARIRCGSSHIPDPHQQMVRCYGRYSNASRGKRRKQTVPAPLNTGLDSTPQPDSPAQRFARQRRRLGPTLEEGL